MALDNDCTWAPVGLLAPSFFAAPLHTVHVPRALDERSGLASSRQRLLGPGPALKPERWKKLVLKRLDSGEGCRPCKISPPRPHDPLGNALPFITLSLCSHPRMLPPRGKQLPLQLFCSGMEMPNETSSSSCSLYRKTKKAFCAVLSTLANGDLSS